MFRSILIYKSYDLMCRPFVRIHLSVVVVVTIIVTAVTKASTYGKMNKPEKMTTEAVPFPSCFAVEGLMASRK